MLKEKNVMKFFMIKEDLKCSFHPLKLEIWN